MNENIRVFDDFYNGFRAFRENLKALNPILLICLTGERKSVSPFVPKYRARAGAAELGSLPFRAESIRKGRQNRLKVREK